MLETVTNWLKTYEFIAIWLEGIALILIFVWDRLDSRNQHEETMQQLQISQKQADALTNSERAWVMVNVYWHSGAGRIIDGQSVINGVVLDLVTANVDCFIHNNGRSPAWVTEKRIGIAIVDGEHLPSEPELDRTPVRDVTLQPMAPDGDYIWHVQPGCQGPRELGKLMIVYGAVTYRDIFDEIRETRFGYMVNPSGELERIPSFLSYNKYT